MIFFLNKGIIQKVCSVYSEGGGGAEGRGEVWVSYLYDYSVKKISWFFKQQIEFFLIICLAVAKSFKGVFYQKDIDIFLKNFFYEHVNTFIVIVNVYVYMLNLQQNNYFLSFLSLIFSSKIHKHPETFLERGVR